MSISICKLPERAVFEITGPEARSFLQGLVTADVESLEPGNAAHAGLLTPQGKIMFDFFVFATNTGFLIDCATSQKPELMKRLTFYKLRADVEIVARDDLAVAAAWGAQPQPIDDVTIFADPRLQEMGARLLATPEVLQGVENTDAHAYHLHRISHGIADTDADIGSSEMFPHEANFDQQASVSFKKGCYVGQEVVSRMQHRGTARSRIVPVVFAGDAPEPKTEIRAGGKKIGQVLSVVGNRGLALVRLDRAQQAVTAGDTLTANEMPVSLEKPAWAKFDM